MLGVEEGTPIQAGSFVIIASNPKAFILSGALACRIRPASFAGQANAQSKSLP